MKYSAQTVEAFFKDGEKYKGKEIIEVIKIWTVYAHTIWYKYQERQLLCDNC